MNPPLSLRTETPFLRPWLLLCTGFGLGAVSLLSQLAVIRELSTVLTGNELFLGLALAAWLGGTAFGARRFAGLAARGPAVLLPLFPLSLLAMAVGLPAGLLLARSARVWLFLAPGVEAGLGAMLIATLVSTLLPALGGGLGFAALLGAAPPGPRADRWPARLAAVETAGAGAAGVAYTFLLAWSWDPWQLCAWVLGAAGLALLGASLAFRARTWVPPALVLLALCLALPWPALERLSAAWARIPGTRVLSLATARGRADLYRERGQSSAFYSGAFAFTVPDPARAEPRVLVPLAAASGPKRVALFGDDPEVLALWLSQPGVQTVTVLVPDPQAHSAWLSALPPYLARAEDDPRVRLRFGDGRWWLKHDAARFDAAVLALPLPTTLALNRFYTRDFLTLLARRLEPAGVVVYALPYSPNRLQAREARLLAACWRTLGAVFSQRLVLAGDALFLLGSARAPLGSLTPAGMADEARRLGWQGRTLPVAAVPSAFDTAWSAQVQAKLSASRGEPNTDAWPVVTGLGSLLWLSMNFGPVTALLLAGLAVWAWTTRKRFARPSRMELRLFAAGGAAMCLELFALTAFQSAQGDLWQDLGLLFAAYMAGSALGSAWAAQGPERKRLGIWTWALAVLAAGGMAGVFLAEGNLGVTLAVLAGGGMCVGAIYGGLCRGVSATEAAKAWAADLSGGLVGALLAGTLLLPILGPYAGLVPAALVAFSAWPGRAVKP